MNDYTGWLGEEIFAAKRVVNRTQATDFSLGPGLEPTDLRPTPGYDYALPEDGGRYRGRAASRDLNPVDMPKANNRNVFGEHIPSPKPRRAGRRSR
ncbi:hypothetical protein [Mycobacterium intracellulare]|uniref:hypothetical protein n=1 Tax=Mycobacterium intracellulare TaxID=1767 RepID=UPI001914DAF8|nr:hypothetical protein [Mycobacterium intracellulare]